MLSIPPHSSHRLQPLDITFFGPLKRAYNYECQLFMKTYPNQKLSPNDLPSIFTKAYGRVATVEKGIKGFQATGIFPVNPEIFSEEVFAASILLEPNFQEIDATNNQTGHQKDSTSSQFTEINARPSTSATAAENSTNLPRNKTAISLNDNTTPNRPSTSAIGILTPSTENQGEAIVSVAKPICNDDISEAGYFVPSDTIAPLTHEVCMFCREFGRYNETWYRCTMCSNWAHKQCTGGQTPVSYVCDYCT